MTRKVVTVLAGLALAGVFGWMLARTLDWRRVTTILLAARWSWLAAALAALAVDYAIRIARWGALLRLSGAPASFSRVAPPFLAGFAINNILPLRAGDLMRVVMAKRVTGISLSAGIGTLFIERFWDLATLSVLFVIGLQGADSHSSSALAPAATAIGLATAAALLVVAFLGGPMARRIEVIGACVPFGAPLFAFAASFCRSLTVVSRPGALSQLAVYSALAWICEGLVLYACAKAIGLHLSVLAVCFILSTANFSSLLPGTPGNIGTFHYFAVLAAKAFAIPSDPAAALAILFHALMWVTITVTGGFCLLATYLITPAHRPSKTAP